VKYKNDNECVHLAHGLSPLFSALEKYIFEILKFLENIYRVYFNSEKSRSKISCIMLYTKR
jgi:hypothetical protein